MTRFAAVALLLATSCPNAAATSPRTIDITMHYSHFSVARIDVTAGTTITFHLHNTDPIAHEFIIGTLAEQRAHETGARIDHNGLPGQASLPADSNATIVYTFTHPGELQFACHLPGHYAYGMHGEIDVT